MTRGARRAVFGALDIHRSVEILSLLTSLDFLWDGARTNSMAETIDRLPIPRRYLGMFPILLVGVVYTLVGVVALLKNSVPAQG